MLFTAHTDKYQNIIYEKREERELQCVEKIIKWTYSRISSDDVSDHVSSSHSWIYIQLIPFWALISAADYIKHLNYTYYPQLFIVTIFLIIFLTINPNSPCQPSMWE